MICDKCKKKDDDTLHMIQIEDDIKTYCKTCASTFLKTHKVNGKFPLIGGVGIDRITCMNWDETAKGMPTVPKAIVVTGDIIILKEYS